MIIWLAISLTESLSWCPAVTSPLDRGQKRPSVLFHVHKPCALADRRLPDRTQGGPSRRGDTAHPLQWDIDLLLLFGIYFFYQYPFVKVPKVFWQKKNSFQIQTCWVLVASWLAPRRILACSQATSITIHDLVCILSANVPPCNVFVGTLNLEQSLRGNDLSKKHYH